MNILLIIIQLLLLLSDDIKCVCPDGHNYLDTKYNFEMDDGDAIVEIEYFCLPVGSILSTMNSVLFDQIILATNL